MSARIRYLKFVGVLAAIVLALMLIGFLPTRAIAGEGTWPSMFVGCLVSLVASAVGAVPLAMNSGDTSGGMQLAFMAMAIRLAAVVAGGVVAASIPGLSAPVVLIWIAISYMVLLIADTRFGLTILRAL